MLVVNGKLRVINLDTNLLQLICQEGSTKERLSVSAGVHWKFIFPGGGVAKTGRTVNEPESLFRVKVHNSFGVGTIDKILSVSGLHHLRGKEA